MFLGHGAEGGESVQTCPAHVVGLEVVEVVVHVGVGKKAVNKGRERIVP